MPAIHRHLNQFRAELIKRFDQGRFFWELRACKYWDEFATPKIVYPNISKRNEFAWDEENYLTNQKAFIIPNASKYLLAVLNSSVVMWLYSLLLSKLQGDFYEPSAIFLDKFPIPNATPAEQQTIAAKVELILAAKAADAGADVSQLEREIDELVADLYGLDDAEKKLVGIG